MGFLANLWSRLDAAMYARKPDYERSLHSLCGDDECTAAKFGRLADILVSPWVLTDRQIRALELVIAQSKDATPLCKQAVIWLLRQSEKLSVDVMISFSLDQDSNEIASGVHDMRSCNGTTHLNERIALTGARFWIASGSGNFAAGKPEQAGYHTVWVSKTRHNDRQAKVVNPDMPAIRKISLCVKDIVGEDFYQFPK
jgi:hypothetical protein